jgi:hypothetical protein
VSYHCETGNWRTWPEPQFESNSEEDKDAEEDRINEEDDEDEEFNRKKEEDDEAEDIYSDDMRALLFGTGQIQCGRRSYSPR